MNKAEIMTLLKSKVPSNKIRIAIMAGKISGILLAADNQIDAAEQFSENADWTEMLKIMEGTLDKEVDFRSDEMTRPSKIKTKTKYSD